MRTNGGSKKKLYPRILLQTPVNRSDHAELHGQSSINEHEALLTIPEPLPAGIQGTGPAHHWPKFHAGGTPAANFVAGCTLGLFARSGNGLKSRKRRNLRQNFIPSALQILRKINFDPGIARVLTTCKARFFVNSKKARGDQLRRAPFATKLSRSPASTAAPVAPNSTIPTFSPSASSGSMLLEMSNKFPSSTLTFISSSPYFVPLRYETRIASSCSAVSRSLIS